MTHTVSQTPSEGMSVQVSNPQHADYGTVGVVTTLCRVSQTVTLSARVKGCPVVAMVDDVMVL